MTTLVAAAGCTWAFESILYEIEELSSICTHKGNLEGERRDVERRKV